MNRTEHGSWHGEHSITVHDDDGLRVVVLPERGGKIVSLIDRWGREWLEQPVLPLPEFHRVIQSFVEGDMCGWDECAPTIDECLIDTHRYPDHGDLWSTRWRALGAGWIEASSSLGYRLARRVSLVDGAVRVDYLATADRRMPFLWAAHPQFSATPGSHVRLPDAVRVLIDVEDPQLRRHDASAALTSLGSVALGGSRKLYPDPEQAVGTATLVHPDGSELTMTWDDTVAPYVGLWYDRGTHSRNDIVAIEPATGYFDSCRTALHNGRVTMLMPEQQLTWWVELHATRS